MCNLPRRVQTSKSKLPDFQKVANHALGNAVCVSDGNVV